MSIKKDLSELVEKQVIDVSTADRIRRYYEESETKWNASTIISIVAACLVGIGVVSIIAYNWDDLPTALRLLMAVVPFGLASWFSYYTLKNKSEKRNWMESAAILQGLCFASSFALICQIYQLQSDDNTFYHILLLTAIPFMFVFRSAGLAFLFIVLGCWDIMDCKNLGLVEITVLIADVLFLYFYYYRRKEKLLLGLRVVCLPVVYGVFFFVALCEWKDWESFAITMSIIPSVIYVFMVWIQRTVGHNASFLKFLFYLSFFGMILLYSHNAKLNDIDIPTLSFLQFVFVALPIFASVGYKLYKKEIPHWQEYAGIVLMVCIMLFLQNSIVMNIIALGVIGYAIYESCKKYDLMELNMGIIALFVWSLVVLNKFNLPFYMNGVILILLGVALICMNRFLIAKKKENGVEEVR